MMTVGIIGGKSSLARTIASELQQKQYAVQLYELPEFDGTDFAAMAKVIQNCDVWINCAETPAACLLPDALPKDVNVNTVLPGHLGELAALHKRYAIHLSSAAVFSSLPQARLFSEGEESYSTGGYGRSRANGEKAFLLHNPSGIVLRLGWLYGCLEDDFIACWCRDAMHGKALTVDTQLKGTLCSLALLIRSLQAILEFRPNGIYHLAARGCTKRIEVATLLISALHCQVSILHGAENDAIFPALLQCRKIDAILGFKRPGWENDLLTFLQHGILR